VKIALLGCGTVGAQVARLLLEQKDDLTARIGAVPELVKVLVRDVGAPRDVTLPDGLLTDDADEALAGVDLIVHAGDVGPVEVLDRLERLAPVHGVYGNVDGRPVRGRLPEWVKFDVAGVRFLVTHIGGHPKRWAPGVAPVLGAERPGVFVCGHSHILRIERVPAFGGMLYLNPGAAGRQGFHQVKTCVRLRVEGGAARQAEVIHLDG
jgi:putative phosphoesterase